MEYGPGGLIQGLNSPREITWMMKWMGYGCIIPPMVP